MVREDGRAPHEMRALSIERHYTKFSLGSVLVSVGDTRVLCTASVEDGVPPFMKGSGEGWLTAEYSLLPSSSSPRIRREVSRGKPSGRTSEIQRLIGRSLRAAVDLSKLGERTIYIDADVIQADGGTRTAAITGAMVALEDAIDQLIETKQISENPIVDRLAAISVGVVHGNVLCDLCYIEDSKAEVDMNVVRTESGKFIEIQGTAEEAPFSQEELLAMLDSASGAIDGIFEYTKQFR